MTAYNANNRKKGRCSSRTIHNGLKFKLSISPLLTRVTVEMLHKSVKLSGLNPFDRSYHEALETLDISVITSLCELINASVSLISSPLVTQLALYERNPNAWVIEQLVNGSADISSTTLVLTPESDNVVRYSIAVGTFRPQLYYKAQSIRMANNIYFIPFSVDTWVTFMCLLLFITVLLTFIVAREVRLPHDTPYDIIARIADEKHEAGIDWKSIDLKSTSEETLRQRERWELGDIFLVIVGALCQQGSERDPSTVAARILLLALFILVVLLYTAFSASVISLISLLPKTDQEQHSGWRLAKNSSLYLQDTNFFRHNFMVPNPSSVLYAPLKVGLEYAVYGKACFVGDRDTSLLTLNQLAIPVDLRCSIGRTFLGIEYQRVFAIRNGSIYLSAINYNILRFRQFGLLSREKTRIFKEPVICGMKERAALSGFVSVDRSDIMPALQLIFYGWVLSVALFFFEHIIFQSSYKIREVFQAGWMMRETHAEKIFHRWLKKKTVEGLKKNKELILSPPKQESTGDTQYQVFMN